MSLPRFYLPAQNWKAEALSLEGDEAHHCAVVMRKQIGDEIIVFNGEGVWAKARITATENRHVSLETLETGGSPSANVTISLIQSIPKGGNMELIIEKAVELGVNVIYPVFTTRTVVKLDAKDAVKKQVKWQRLALEACKQCGQNWLPIVKDPVSFSSCLASLPEQDLKVIAAIQDDAQPLKTILSDYQMIEDQPAKRVALAIGPEGDFTPAEYASAREAGFLPMSLGSIILRVETATMFSVSVLRHELG